MPPVLTRTRTQTPNPNPSPNSNPSPNPSPSLEQVFVYIQSISMYLAPPIVCVYFVGALWPPASSPGTICLGVHWGAPVASVQTPEPAHAARGGHRAARRGGAGWQARSARRQRRGKPRVSRRHIYLCIHIRYRRR